MSNVFVARSIPVKSKEEKKVSRLAIKVNSRVRDARKPGPVTIIVLKS